MTPAIMLLMLYLIAITAEAMTGALSAGRRGVDWFGVVLIACVTVVVLGVFLLGWRGVAALVTRRSARRGSNAA